MSFYDGCTDKTFINSEIEKAILRYCYMLIIKRACIRQVSLVVHEKDESNVHEK